MFFLFSGKHCSQISTLFTLGLVMKHGSANFTVRCLLPPANLWRCPRLFQWRVNSIPLMTQKSHKIPTKAKVPTKTREQIQWNEQLRLAKINQKKQMTGNETNENTWKPGGRVKMHQKKENYSKRRNTFQEYNSKAKEGCWARSA